MTVWSLVAAISIIAIGLGVALVLSWLWTGDRLLTGIVAFAYLIRSVLALALYGLSSSRGPLLHDLQLGGGFWAFAPDSVYYHEYAKSAVVALRAYLELPYAYGSPDYPLMVAGMYRIAGPHPLVPVSVNIWLAAFTVLLVYLLARRLWMIAGARVAAALTAFWPSSILWSTQVLKDTIEIFLIVAFLYLFCRLVERLDDGKSDTPRHVVGLAAGTCMILAGAYLLRFYIGLALLISALTVLAIISSRDLWHRHYARATAAIGLATFLVCAVWIGTWIIPDNLAKPIDPARTSRRLAAHMVSIGDVDGALWQLQAALLQGKDVTWDRAERERLARPELERLISAHGNLAALETPDMIVAPEASDAPPAFPGEMPGLSTLSQLQDIRVHYFQNAGSVIGDPNQFIDSLGALIQFAPQAFTNALLSPNPWTRFGTAGSTGIFRRVAIIEVLFIPFLLYFSAMGARSLMQHHWKAALLLLLFSITLTAALGYAIPTIGILFRLRLAALVPLWILAAGGSLPPQVVRLWYRFALFGSAGGGVGARPA